VHRVKRGATSGEALNEAVWKDEGTGKSNTNGSDLLGDRVIYSVGSSAAFCQGLVNAGRNPVCCPDICAGGDAKRRAAVEGTDFVDT